MFRRKLYNLIKPTYNPRLMESGKWEENRISAHRVCWQKIAPMPKSIKVS
jgi:hypothetical protein